MKRILDHGPLAVLMLFLAMCVASCAQFGVPQPETLAQRIAVTVTGATAARQTTLTLLQAKKLTPDDAENIQRQADNVIAGAQVARTLIGTDPAGADAKLQQTRAVLIALQAYLATREGK